MSAAPSVAREYLLDAPVEAQVAQPVVSVRDAPENVVALPGEPCGIGALAPGL